MNRVLKILLDIGVIVKNTFVQIGVHPLSKREEEVIMKRLEKVHREVKGIYSLIDRGET